ncbi:MAG: EmrB/QacA subfamily drug resistance transporter [Acidimicrobiales bacterium]|jgi:EmrB/QacA subfamily drug resistance transporter
MKRGTTILDSDALPRTVVPARAWKALAVSSAGAVLVSFNSTATNIAFDDLTRSFPEAGQNIVSWTSSGFFLGLAGFMLVGGRLADRTGRRRVFRIGMMGFVVSAVLSALAPTIWILIGARVLQAISGALVLPASLAMILPEFPKERHGTAVGVWAATSPIASAFAPTVAAVMLEFASWRWLYLITAPIAAITLLAGWRLLRESKADSAPGRLDLLGVTQGTLAISLLVFAVSQGPAWGWTDPIVVGSLAAAFVLMPLFVFQSRRHPAPLLNLTLFVEKPVWTANLANFLLHVAGMSSWLMWPLYMSRVWGWDNFTIGLALTPGPVFSGIATTVAGRLSDKYGYKSMLRIGSLILVLGMSWEWYSIGPDANYFTSLFPTIAAMGTGWAMVSPQLNGALLKHVHQNFWGEVNASFNTVRNVAAALGIAVAIALVGEATGVGAAPAFEPLWVFYVVMMALMALTIWFLFPTKETVSSTQN